MLYVISIQDRRTNRYLFESQWLEKLDTSKKSMYEIERKFLDTVQEILRGEVTTSIGKLK